MAPLRGIALGDSAASAETVKNVHRLIDAEIVAIQKTIMKGARDAGEGDSEPPK